MQPGKGLVIRLVVSVLVLLYLAGDLLVMRGPLHRRLPWPRRDAAAAPAVRDGSPAVARVCEQVITRRQLDRAVAEQLWLQGQSPRELAAGALAVVRRKVLDDLIDQELLRLTVGGRTAETPVDNEAIDAAVVRFAARFASAEDLSAALRHEGIGGEAELRARLAAGLQRAKFLATGIAPAVVVGDDEARLWFDRHRDELALPERVRARHVFLATLDRDPEEARAKLAVLLERLERKEVDFATVAAEASEDERSKHQGGDLGWFSRTRLPADFTGPVFALATGKPTMLRSKLGWHLVEVTDRRPAEPRAWADAKSDVVAALESAKRGQAVAAFRAELRSTHAADVRILEEDLGPVPSEHDHR